MRRVLPVPSAQPRGRRHARVALQSAARDAGIAVANKKFVVKLSDEERARLNGLISKGKAAAKAILKARILLKADQS